MFGKSEWGELLGVGCFHCFPSFSLAIDLVSGGFLEMVASFIIFPCVGFGFLCFGCVSMFLLYLSGIV